MEISARLNVIYNFTWKANCIYEQMPLNIVSLKIMLDKLWHSNKMGNVFYVCYLWIRGCWRHWKEKVLTKHVTNSEFYILVCHHQLIMQNVGTQLLEQGPSVAVFSGPAWEDSLIRQANSHGSRRFSHQYCTKSIKLDHKSVQDTVYMNINYFMEPEGTHLAGGCVLSKLG
jgi:hypothetical protein